MLRHGLGGSIDPEGFFKWTKKAIELGDEAAYVALGDAYAGGIGTKRDYSAAIVSFEKAIAVGREIARKRLAEVQEDKRFWESLTPGLDWPTEDRWGSFEVGGSPAVGIADEHALLAVVCLNNELMVLYTPGGTPFFDVRPQEAASLLLMPDNGSVYVFDTAAQASYFVTDTASVRDLIGVFTRANSIKVGITDAPNAQQFFLYDSATFTGRGSSAAIKTISNNCG